jgi:hypothetical protein
MTSTFDVSLTITSVQDAYMTPLFKKYNLDTDEFVKKALIEYIAAEAEKEFPGRDARNQVMEEDE